MVVKTKKHKRRMSVKTRKWGGGLFNFLRSKFGTQRKPQKIQSLPKWPPRGYSSPSASVKNESILPLEAEAESNGRQFFPDYESYKDASQRMFAYVYQMYKQSEKPFDERTYDAKKITLSPQERSELKKAFVRAMYNIGQGRATYNEAQLDDMTKRMFGLADADMDAFRQKYIEVESTSPGSGPSIGLPPLRPFGYISRLIPALLKTDREINYTSNQEMYICSPRNYAKNNARTLNSNECVLLVRSIPALYKNLIHNPIFTNAFYMVLSPQYFPVGGETIKADVFNTSINSTSNITVSIVMKHLTKVSFVQDAFENGAIELFHPRLGLLFQEQNPDLWGRAYFNTKGRGLDILDRIVILTLQKYAAIRRYMWTKDPMLTATVYKVNPKSIANELRDPYSVLPETVISQKNRESALFNVLKRIPSYSGFDEKAFLKEFIENQRWASGGRIKYKSVMDPALDKILPRDVWALPGPYKEVESVRIRPLPELQEVETERVGRGE
jgi:hypothetical protein